MAANEECFQPKGYPMDLTNLDMTDWPAWLRDSLHIRSWPCPADIRIVVAVDLRPIESGGPVLRFSMVLIKRPVFGFLTLPTGLTETEIHRLLESLASQVRAMTHTSGPGGCRRPPWDARRDYHPRYPVPFSRTLHVSPGGGPSTV